MLRLRLRRSKQIGEYLSCLNMMEMTNKTQAFVLRSFVVLYEDAKHESPSIVTESSEFANELGSMSVDELWSIREKVDEILSEKITAELDDLKRRLALLKPEVEPHADRKASKKAGSRRGPYPSVLPKYQNPDFPSETWVGRGRQPRWFKTQLGLGRRLEDLMIS